MHEEKIMVTEFVINYPVLDDKLFMESDLIAQFVLISLKCARMKDGFIANKVFKTNSSGTKIRYTAASAEVIEKEFEKLSAEKEIIEERIYRKIRENKI